MNFYKCFKLLIQNNANPYLVSNDGHNVFHVALLYDHIEILNYLLDHNYPLSFLDHNGETLLQNAIKHNNPKKQNLPELTNSKKIANSTSKKSKDFLLPEYTNIIFKILNKTFNLNNKNTNNGLTILHQSILANNIDIFKLLLQKNIDIHICDFYGNTALHYILYEKRNDFLTLLLNNSNIKFNLVNINGDTPLHIMLDYDNINVVNKDLFTKFIIETDINLQNNMGITCFMKIIDKNIIEDFYFILIKKPLNIFIQNKYIDKIKNNSSLLNLLIDSYYYQLDMNRHLIVEWEIWCAKNKNTRQNFQSLNKEDAIMYKKILKSIKNKSKKQNKKILQDNNIEYICKEKIKSIILYQHRSLPALKNITLHLDNGIMTNMSFYTGSPIDVLFGLLFLFKEFNKSGLSIILDYPLSINNNLEVYYSQLGMNYPYKLDFSNIEILWSYQKLFYPSFFDIEIERKKQISKYIIIPIGIETSIGSHANILFWDIKEKTIERFEPSGANYPIGLNYNPDLLDSLLEHKFKNYDSKIKYYRPENFLPTISFQILENLEIDKKIGDPNGFCCVWCVWWIYQRMVNLNYGINDIANELIKRIKLDNISFKHIIRTFSSNITTIRDKFLQQYDLDINLWLEEKYSEEILIKFEKNIFNYLNII